MKRNPRTRTIKARALTNPRPSFVSLVGAGANQRPFQSVKSDGTAKSPSIEDQEMANQTTALKAGYDIAALTFAAPQFTSLKAVQDWLDEGGYEGYEITEEGTTFVVANKTMAFEEGTTETLEGAVAGLTVSIGKLAEEAVAEKTDAEIEAEAAKSNASSVQPVAIVPDTEAAKEDAAPAGDAPATEAEAEAATGTEVASVKAALETFEATMGELRKSQKGMYEANALHDILRALRWMVEDAEWNGLSEEDVAAIKAAATNLIVVMGNAMSQTMQMLEEAFRSILGREAAAKEDATPATEVAGDEKPAEAEAAPTQETTEAAPVAETVEPVVEPVAKADWELAIEKLTATVGALAAKIEAGQEAPKTEVEGDAQVQKADDAVQTRKGSGDVTPPATPVVSDEKAKEERTFAERRLRSSLGLSPSR